MMEPAELLLGNRLGPRLRSGHLAFKVSLHFAFTIALGGGIREQKDLEFKKPEGDGGCHSLPRPFAVD